MNDLYSFIDFFFFFALFCFVDTVIWGCEIKRAAKAV